MISQIVIFNGYQIENKVFILFLILSINLYLVIDKTYMSLGTGKKCAWKLKHVKSLQIL